MPCCAAAGVAASASASPNLGPSPHTGRIVIASLLGFGHHGLGVALHRARHLERRPTEGLGGCQHVVVLRLEPHPPAVGLLQHLHPHVNVRAQLHRHLPPRQRPPLGHPPPHAPPRAVPEQRG